MITQVIEKYSKLSFINKIFFWSSLASIIALVFTILSYITSQTSSESKQTIFGDKNIQIQGNNNKVSLEPDENIEPPPKIPETILSTVSDKKYHINNFEFSIDDLKLLFGNQSKIFMINFDDFYLLEHVYIMKNPFIDIRCSDGIPDDSNNLVEFNKNNAIEKLRETDTYKFSFFSEESTTIGILHSRAGASGGSTQTLYLIDTKSDKYAEVNFVDCTIPYWVDTDQHPPKYATIYPSYIGGHASGLGISYKRIAEIYTFNNNKFSRNEAVEERWFDELYFKSILTKSEMDFIRNKDLYYLTNNRSDELDKILIKLLDNIHYAKKTHREEQVLDVIKLLDKSVQEEVSIYLEE